MGGPLQGIKTIWADERWKGHVSDPAPCFLESELLGCSNGGKGWALDHFS